MRFFLLTLLCVFSFGSFAGNLPPEHEAARLLLVIEEAVKREDWSKADESLSKMAELSVDLPVPFHFYNGLVHFQQARFDKAQRSLEHYVVKIGPSGAFYYDALRLLTSVENALNESGQSQKTLNGDKDQYEIKPSGRDAYVQSLKALYLTDNDIQALSMQVNSLLSAHPFTGTRLKKSAEKQGVIFQLSIQGNQLLLQEKDYQSGYPQLTVSRFELNGVDPFVKYACSSQEIKCWVYHPANEHDRWFYFDNDEVVAGELAQALTRLIQAIQQK